jgi:hypothetical protein
VWLSFVFSTPAGCPTTAASSVRGNVFFLIGTAIFRHKLQALARHAVKANKAGRKARLQAAATEAAARVRGVRHATVLHSSLELLHELASGLSSPRDHHVRQRCQSEESYLRELTLLDPALAHLGEWLAQSLAVAHEKSVSLQIRPISSDAPTAKAAAEVGGLLLDVTNAAPKGSGISFGVYSRDGILTASIVSGIAPLRSAMHSRQIDKNDGDMTYAELDDEALAEVCLN